jgi:transcriptional regulator with XRE-family HTH domain
MSRKPASNMDKTVGRNIKVYRLAKGLSQTELADSLGLTFQQVQKYEKGVNRVGSGRLFQISNVLDVPLMSFFEGGDAATSSREASPFDLLADPQSLKLVQAFAEITNRRTRRAVVALVEAMISSD